MFSLLGRFKFNLENLNFKNYFKKLQMDQSIATTTLAGLSGWTIDDPPFDTTLIGKEKNRQTHAPIAKRRVCAVSYSLLRCTGEKKDND